MTMPAFVEETVAFDVAGQRLFGVVARPSGPWATDTGVVIVSGGAQTRVGANRRFVGVARTLAAAGHPVLRFDQRGMGDSEGEHPGFQAAGPDIAGAMAALRASAPSLQRTVLLGLCDGASAAVLALPSMAPAHVDGMVLINPWVHTPGLAAQSLVRTHYRERLQDRGWWRRLLAGGVSAASIARAGQTFWRSRKKEQVADFVDAMFAALARFDGPVLLVLSGRDRTAQECAQLIASNRLWAGLAARPAWSTCTHPDADHTHTGDPAGRRLEMDVLTWIRTAVQPTLRGTG